VNKSENINTEVNKSENINANTASLIHKQDSELAMRSRLN